MTAIILAGLHYLALGIGLGSVYARGRYFKIAINHHQSQASSAQLKPLFLADNFWGLAAILWIVTGLLRALGHWEKGSDFYLNSSWFWLKMTIFGLVFLLELLPMITLIRWRSRIKKSPTIETPLKLLGQCYRLNQMELCLILLIPFVAAAMARAYSFNS